MNGDSIVVTHDPLDLGNVLASIDHDRCGNPRSDREAGALVIFSGMVRETEGDHALIHLDYDHYEGMAQQEIARLLAEARRQWPISRAALWHRIGPVAVSESSVIVAVSAGHRAEAFDAARFLIDELKKSVPIWKRTPTQP